MSRACSSAPHSTTFGSHITEEMVATLQMSIRMAQAAKLREALLIFGGRKYVAV
jgi:hypothetical protein